MHISLLVEVLWKVKRVLKWSEMQMQRIVGGVVIAFQVQKCCCCSEKKNQLLLMSQRINPWIELQKTTKKIYFQELAFEKA